MAHEDSLRLLKNIYLFDGLRADRTTAAHRWETAEKEGKWNKRKDALWQSSEFCIIDWFYCSFIADMNVCLILWIFENLRYQKVIENFPDIRRSTGLRQNVSPCISLSLWYIQNCLK
jgi:hypothetical protein